MYFLGQESRRYLQIKQNKFFLRSIRERSHLHQSYIILVNIYNKYIHSQSDKHLKSNFESSAHFL
jgi:hypothetical protein